MVNNICNYQYNVFGLSTICSDLSAFDLISNILENNSLMAF